MPRPPASPRYPGFHLDENLQQLRREWRMQRIAWPLLYLLLLGCVLGLFGQGPLSRTQAASADGRLHVDFDRFLRRQSDDRLVFTLKPVGSGARLQLDPQWAGRFDIEQVFPEPEHRVATADAVTLVFATAPGTTVTVRMRLRTDEIGRLAGWAALDGGERVPVRQFVYP